MQKEWICLIIIHKNVHVEISLVEKSLGKKNWALTQFFSCADSNANRWLCKPKIFLTSNDNLSKLDTVLGMNIISLALKKNYPDIYEKGCLTKIDYKVNLIFIVWWKCSDHLLRVPHPVDRVEALPWIRVRIAHFHIHLVVLTQVVPGGAVDWAAEAVGHCGCVPAVQAHDAERLATALALSNALWWGGPACLPACLKYQVLKPIMTHLIKFLGEDVNGTI